LYGRLAPKNALERYEYSDENLFEDLWEIPQSPEDYVAKDPEISKRWQFLEETTDGSAWIPAFYKLPENKPDPFHALCKFYRTFMYCESRLIMHCTKQWVEKWTLTLLKYELLSLREELIALLTACEDRLKESREETSSMGMKLEQFMVPLLRNQLLILISELGDRYHHLMEDKPLTLEELYVKRMRQPVPDQQEWYITGHYIDFYLEKYLRPPAELENIEKLLSIAYRDYDKIEEAGDKERLAGEIQRLENVILCYIMLVETEQVEPYDLLDTEQNRQYIEEWTAALDNTEQRDESFRLHHLMRRMGYCRDIIRIENSSSEAGELLLRLEDIFDPSAGRDGLSNTPSVQEEPVVPTKEHWALQEYISVEAIREKLGVHMNTLNRYFKESDAPVIQITQKIKWMHVDDFHAFMQEHKE
jgi:hypothetical protein